MFDFLNVVDSYYIEIFNGLIEAVETVLAGSLLQKVTQYIFWEGVLVEM
jgi:hypothetical protein